ncbi:hypothetical protein VTK56DRAFT_9113 [Thermocarpiscus australiensis]
MSPHTALRLTVRSLRGATIFDQFATTAAASPRSLSQLPPLCLRCSISFRAGPGYARRFSTAPPPPKQPTSDGNSAETPVSGDSHTEAAAAAASSPSSSSTTQPELTAQTSSNDNADRSLPSFTENHRHPLSARFSTFMDNLQSRALTASQKINDLTGYSAIEAIKARNSQLELELAAAQRRLRAARQSYKSLTAHRAATQREVTTLLARKDTWQPADLERFTSLYRLDHELEAQVAGAGAELTEAETDEARLSGELNAGILKRYHEEQIWSDRIRRQSTWGTWGLMGVNVVLFLVLQFVAEPWRRKRLMRGIAESERGVMEEVRRELGEVRAALEASGLREYGSGGGSGRAAEVPGAGESAVGAAGAAPEPTTPVSREEEEVARKPWKEVLARCWSNPELLKTAMQDLYSDRRTDLRMRDVSLIAVEGAAAGAAVVATVAFALMRNART